MNDRIKRHEPPHGGGRPRSKEVSVGRTTSRELPREALARLTTVPARNPWLPDIQAITKFDERQRQLARPHSEVINALQLLTVTDVCQLLRMSEPTLWRLRRAGNFPEPMTVTERIFGWRESEIEAWLRARVQSKSY